MRLLPLVATALLAPAWSSLSEAEVSQRGSVRVAVEGNLTPSALPRRSSAPAAVSFAGHISSSSAADPPQLRRVSIALNSHGQIATDGLPRCRLGHISPSTTAEALAACRSSLVGEGHFSADVKLPEQSPFPSEGKILAFNGRFQGNPAILAHIYGSEPIPTSYVLPFAVVPTRGTYGTALKASLPRVTGEWGFVTGISMRLSRTFSAGGELHGYISAACPAPKGFSGVVYPLAKIAFSFEGGLKVSSILTRRCRVRSR